MIDPHVESLTYRLKESESVSYADPPPLSFSNDDFSGLLEEGILQVSMLQHYATVEEARAVVEPFLRAWEIDAALTTGPTGEFVFTPKGAKVVDRSPPEGAVIPAATLSAEIRLSDSISAHISRASYPAPPQGFVASTDVEILWLRYSRFLDGAEPLPGMAYFCLSQIEKKPGPARGQFRARAADLLRIEEEVLSTVGRLSSEYGDETEARKVPRGGRLRPMTPSERQWLRAAIPKLIRQVGVFDAGGRPERLTMQHLPPL